MILAASAAAVLLVIAVPMQLRNRSTATQEVSLSATRGFEPLKVTHGTPLHLIAELRGLTIIPTYTVEIARGTGEPVLTSELQPEPDDKLLIRVDRPLKPGQYWVRIYSDKKKQKLIREFSLPVD